MKKITLQTPNLTAQNIDKIAELFPNCITETKDENGTLKKTVNFDILKQALSEDVIEGNEAYEFTWVGKKAATVEAFKSINKTLRPCPEESVDWDNTKNLYIEGDNLEALKLLQESYLKKVKMIYIDPPYNTGNDFIYKDGFQMTKEEWKEESDEYDDEGNCLYRNTISNGRFHSDWCSMIYSRLLLARGLLTDDGVIFISIDDHEIDNLKKICDEVFGESNFVATFIWTKTSTPPALSYKCRKTVEYVLAYERNINNSKYYGSPLDGGDVPLLNYGNPIKTLLFPEGSIHFSYVSDVVIPAGKKDKVELLDKLKIVDGLNANAIRLVGNFKWEQETLNNEIKKGTFFVIKSDKFAIRFQRQNLEESFKTPTNFLNIELNKESGVGTNETAVKELFEIGLGKCFDYSKPYSLIKTILKMVCQNDPDALVLDFFSGSATTAHAVMQLNAEDGGNRRFIMVQIPEECDEKSEAYKAGYKNICEIGKERIRRAGAKIKESMAQDDSLFSSNTTGLDTGFRVFKVADSNMKDVEIQLNLYTQNKLGKMVENIKPDRTALDLLFGSALEWGYELTLPYTSQQVDGCTIHTYSTGEKVLMACFDKNIPESVFRYIAKQTPKCAVFRDCCFEDCPSKINAEEIIKTLSPDTDVRVI